MYSSDFVTIYDGYGIRTVEVQDGDVIKIHGNTSTIYSTSPVSTVSLPKPRVVTVVMTPRGAIHA